MSSRFKQRSLIRQGSKSNNWTIGRGAQVDQWIKVPLFWLLPRTLNFASCFRLDLVPALPWHYEPLVHLNGIWRADFWVEIWASQSMFVLLCGYREKLPAATVCTYGLGIQKGYSDMSFLENLWRYARVAAYSLPSNQELFSNVSL